jgi:hypothetical protein
VREEFGVTVLELLVAVTIASIAVSAAILSAKTASASIELSITSGRVSALLERASLKAVEAQHDLSVIFSNGSVSVSGGDVAETYKLPENVKLLSIKPKNSVRFYQSSAAAPSVIVFSDGRKQCVIVISLRARVSNSCAAAAAAH